MNSCSLGSCNVSGILSLLFCYTITLAFLYFLKCKSDKKSILTYAILLKRYHQHVFPISFTCPFLPNVTHLHETATAAPPPSDLIRPLSFLAVTCPLTLGSLLSGVDIAVGISAPTGQLSADCSGSAMHINEAPNESGSIDMIHRDYR